MMSAISQGGAFEAVVAARAEGLVKIIFRAHAEFELLNHPDFNYNPSATTGDDQAVMYNGGESEFFYFTPSQFLGEVVMKADGGRVMFADIRVPSGRTNRSVVYLPGTVHVGANVQYAYALYTTRPYKSHRTGPVSVTTVHHVEAKRPTNVS